MAPRRLNFTKDAIAALPPADAGRQATYHDTKVPGLIVLVTASGAKTYYVYRRINGRPERVKIGRCNELTVDQARKLAQEKIGAIAMGQDPARARRDALREMTFGELFAWYMENHSKLRKRSWRDDLDHHRLHLRHLDSLKLRDVTRARVHDVHKRSAERSGIYQANRVLALVRVVFNKAIANDLFAGPNPAQGVEMYREMSRDRRLNADELPAFLSALEAEPNEQFRDFILFSLFTGGRRGNTMAARFDQIDWKARTWRIPAVESKNGVVMVVPLGDEVMEILKRRREATSGPWIFPATSTSGHMESPQKAWRALLARAGIENLRLHDLRRTLGSMMADGGASLHVVGRALGHKSPITTSVYARLSVDPVRVAQDQAVKAMLAAAAPNVVPLAAAASKRARDARRSAKDNL